MPFVVYANSGAVAASDGLITTSATPNTEKDDGWVAITSNVSRAYGVSGVFCSGRNAGLTVISGIAYRLKKWTSTASAGGAITFGPTARDPGNGIFSLIAGFQATGIGALTSGTGGPTYIGGFTSGATGPGGWIGPNANSYLEFGAATTSIDIFSASITPSLKYEAAMEVTVY